VKTVPAYSLASAARLIGSKPSTLRAWFRGRDYTVSGEKRSTLPVLPTYSSAGEPISFIDLVEAHVLFLIRRQFRIPRKNLKAAAETLAKLKGGLMYLAHKDFYFDRTNLFLDVNGALVSLSERGQMVGKPIIEEGLKQLTYGTDGYAEEFFPAFGGSQQREFVISPHLNFGRICIARSGLSADIIALRFENGEKIADIAEDFAVSADEIAQALRWHDRLSPNGERIAA